MHDKPIDIAAAKRRLAELEAERASLAGQAEQARVDAAAAVAARREAVALADATGAPLPQAAPVAVKTMDPGPGLAELDSRIGALREVIRDAEEQARLAELDALVDELERLDARFKETAPDFVKLYADMIDAWHRYEILAMLAYRRGQTVTRKFAGFIPTHRVKSWLEHGRGGWLSACVDCGRLTEQEARELEKMGGDLPA